MILESDIGNSFCKWRVLNASGAVQENGVLPCRDGFGGLRPAAPVERVRVACVAGQSVESQFSEWARQAFEVEPEFVRSSAEVAGVVNGYDVPEQLGVDRWLAIIAAYHHLHQASVVIDVGSALTIDAVSADGRHLGGYIVPGQQLMGVVLNQHTGQVRFENLTAGSLSFGSTTSHAVHNGAMAAVVGAIKVALEQAKRQLPEGFAILVTGGGASQVAPFLDADVQLIPDLVMDGLCWALP